MNKVKVSYRIAVLVASVVAFLFICFIIGDSQNEHSVLQYFTRNITQVSGLTPPPHGDSINEGSYSIVIGLLCLIVGAIFIALSWIMLALATFMIVGGVLWFLGLFDDRPSKDAGLPAKCPSGT